MNLSLVSGGTVRRIGLKVAFGLSLAAAIGAAYAFKTIFARPGEAALRYVPAEAAMVGTIDLNPSPAQALAFKHIDDALSRNGMDRFVETSVLDIFSKKSPGTDALRPLVLRNGAIAMINKSEGKDGQMAGVCFLALTSGTDAEAILKKFGKPMFYRGTKGYALPGNQSPMMVIDDLLVLGSEPYSLHAVRMVKEGSAKSIAGNAEFAAAREHLASDANVMMFVNPKMLGEAPINALKGAKSSWLAAGLAVRDGGLGLSVWSKMDPNSVKGLAEFSRTQGIRKDLFNVLPAGAYGMFVVSQPGNYFDMFETAAGAEMNSGMMIADLSKSMHQNMGVDLHRDVVAGLRGNTVIAAYPATDGATEGAEALLVVDDLNGSDPAAVVDRFQSYVQEQMAKEGNQGGQLWQETKTANARMFRIADKIQEDMRKGMGEGTDPAMLKKDVLFGKKTIAWAMVDKAVIASTSEELLKRAIESYKSHVNPLSKDASFIKSDSEILDGSQIMALFNLGRIAEGVKNTVGTEKMDKDGREMFTTVLSAFSTLGEPFYLKGKVGADGEVSSGAFIPLDYDKVFDFIGKQMKHK